MSLVRATNPAMLRPSVDGFTVDFENLDRKEEFTPDERILMKLRVALQGDAAPENSPATLDLDAAEGQRLAATLEHLEKLQPWPTDVLRLSRNLRARLAAII